MKKQLTLLASSALLATSLMAEHEAVQHNTSESSYHHKEEKFYIVPKAIYSSGDTIQEGLATVEGTNGRGVGLDIGYRTGYGINAEIDYAYTKVDITEREGEEVRYGTGKYHSLSFDLLYAYHITEPFVLFGKVGYEYEKEKIAELGVNKSDTGFLYGAGFEYELKENIAFLVEYEDSTIKGPKGYSVAAGLVIGLDLLP